VSWRLLAERRDGWSLCPLLNAIGADQRLHLIREAHMSLFPLIPNWMEMDGQMDNSVTP